MTVETQAISVLFGILVSFTGGVILYLKTEIKDLKEEIKTLREDKEKVQAKLDESNKASRDLIALQANMLRQQGVQIVPVPPMGGG